MMNLTLFDICDEALKAGFAPRISFTPAPPVKMIYLVMVSRPGSSRSLVNIRAKRTIPKQSIRTAAAAFFGVPEIDVQIL